MVAYMAEWWPVSVTAPWHSPLKILRSRVFHLYSSLILIGLLENFWLKTVFVLEWPILKCLHSSKECQVAYAKSYLNMQRNGKFGCAVRNITSNVSVVKYWAFWSFPDKNPPSRKEIISCSMGGLLHWFMMNLIWPKEECIADWSFV